MNNLVNRLNYYLKLLAVTGIKFEYDAASQHNHAISILLQSTWNSNFYMYAIFSDINMFFKNAMGIYNEIKIKRDNALEHMSCHTYSNYILGYHKINLAGMAFLEILSRCSSLNELELKLQIMGY
jgi:hypothetical protein